MDWSTIIVACFSLVGTLAGSYFSNSKTTALITYRISQLEDKVNKHNNVVERMYHIEESYAVLDEKVRVANKRISDLENEKN